MHCKNVIADISLPNKNNCLVRFAASVLRCYLFVKFINVLSTTSMKITMCCSVERYEVTNQNVILYLRRITAQQLRIVFHMEQRIPVERPQAAKVNVYYYNEPSVSGFSSEEVLSIYTKVSTCLHAWAIEIGTALFAFNDFNFSCCKETLKGVFATSFVWKCGTKIYFQPISKYWSLFLSCTIS